MQVTGILKRINQKSGTSARGPWTAYSICVGPADNNDNDTWYRNGFTPPGVNEGSNVKFEAKQDGDNWKVVGAIEVDKSAPAPTPKSKGRGSFGKMDDATQDSIVRQNATTTAAKIAADMLTLGIVEAPKTPKAARYDFYLELVDSIANHLFPKLRNAPSVEDLASEGVQEAEDDGPPSEDEVWKAV